MRISGTAGRGQGPEGIRRRRLAKGYPCESPDPTSPFSTRRFDVLTGSYRGFARSS